ncbi:probable glutathione S-transferase [Humulus lupulus]|uniref:probable glutathione S-transferase n=1 Tax=Humulus lupulus TaxID=3486 RepID=UPI002B409F4C|nr:probable glutathione S-transferase [Humulus lupulus]XP_062117978.1 probable glutathione S-transferase [Humulus lupulus]
MEEVKVIGSRTSVLCTRVEWALKLKSVEYEYLVKDLRNKSPILLKYNPILKKVPVLLHLDKPIPESLVILEYIDEVWKEKPLLPQHPYERAKARFWAKFSDEKVLMGSFEACKAQGEGKEKLIETAQEYLGFLEKEIEGKKFFGGERIGYLDLAVGWIPLCLDVMEEIEEMKLIEAGKFPYLHQWSKTLMDNPIMAESAPSRKSLVEYFNAGITYLRSLEASKG